MANKIVLLGACKFEGCLNDLQLGSYEILVVIID